MSAFSEFLETAWAEHGERPAEVADRIAASFDLVTASEEVEPFVRLLAHVYGEHLGAYDAGIALMHSLRTREVCASEGAARAIAVRIAALRHAAAEQDALQGLTNEESVTALATAAAMLAGRNEYVRAIDVYRDAVQRSASPLAKGSPMARALAVGGNNLACALEQKPERSASETAGMIMAAERAREFWRIAGTWLEEERAEYRLARSLLAAGRPHDALEAARRGVAVCEANDAPVIERFFASVVLALAHAACGHDAASDAARRSALAMHERVPADQRAWCEGDLAELQTSAGAYACRTAEASSAGAMSATSSAGE